MIRVTVTLSQEGVIGKLEVEGHAGFAPRGNDIVCSAFTVLVRTFARTVESAQGVDWLLAEDSRDRFQLVITGVEPGVAEQYRGWCDFVLRGLADLGEESPQRVQIQYGLYSGRLFHGS